MALASGSVGLVAPSHHAVHRALAKRGIEVTFRRFSMRPFRRPVRAAPLLSLPAWLGDAPPPARSFVRARGRRSLTRGHAGPPLVEWIAARVLRRRMILDSTTPRTTYRSPVYGRLAT
jgi:hypothetical protein